MDSLYQEKLEKEIVQKEVNISLDDEEIMKVLLCCQARRSCNECPYDELNSPRCRDILLNECIGLINRLKQAKVDVAREVTYDFQNRLRHIFLDMCDYNDYGTLNLLQIDSAIDALYDTFIAELKKKYTEEGK